MSQTLTEMLRRVIADSGETLSQLARETGVTQPQLSRFMKGERSLTLESASKLFDYFGLRVEEKPAKKGKKK